ncbi:gp53-like domain-containing protein, partial [Xenorhabdus innexi]
NAALNVVRESASAATQQATNANTNANSRLEKAKNGADIPNKAAFIDNLRLRDTVNKADNALPRESEWTFKSGAHVIRGSEHYATLTFEKNGGSRTVIQTQPDKSEDMLNISQGDWSIYIPKKNGTLATMGDLTDRIGAGQGQIPDMSFFQSQKGISGYQKLPSGVIIQWGRAGYKSPQAFIDVSFLIHFPHRCTFVTGMEIGRSVAVGATVINAVTPGPSQSTVTLTARNTKDGEIAKSADVLWLAVGY